MTFSWTAPTFHLGPLLVAGGTALWYLEATSHDELRATRGQRLAFFGGLLSAVVALSWPLADLATSVSLLAVVAQRLVLVLVTAPLLLLGTPPSVMARLTRPAPIDAVARRLVRPLTALVVTTVTLGVTALPFSVAWASEHAVVRIALLVAVLCAGIVLWLPVIDRVPGVTHLRPMLKGGYLVAQALAPTFLSFAWIFALHPLYHSLHGQHRALGIAPLTDQQLSGYLAKLATFGVLLSVAYALFMRSDASEELEDDPLRWADVQREFERAERAERRSGATGSSA